MQNPKCPGSLDLTHGDFYLLNVEKLNFKSTERGFCICSRINGLSMKNCVCPQTMVSLSRCWHNFVVCSITALVIPLKFLDSQFVSLFVLSGNIDEAERQWKLEFHRWSSYMMHWKSQFDHYSKQERCTDLWVHWPLKTPTSVSPASESFCSLILPNSDNPDLLEHWYFRPQTSETTNLWDPRPLWAPTCETTKV